MPRRSERLPTLATTAVSELLNQCRQEVMRLKDEAEGLERKIHLVRAEVNRLYLHQDERRQAARQPFEVSHGETLAERSARGAELQRALQEFEEGEAERERELRAERSRLGAAYAAAEDAFLAAKTWVRGLRYDQASDEGLAPWDREALDALRRLGALPASTESDGAVLKGKEVAALAKNRLGVSRSLYYERLRPLLKAHYLMEHHWLKWDNGEVDLLPASAKRFRRDEVEALFRFIRTGKVAAAV